MSFDSQDPFANGPFIIPVNGGYTSADSQYEGPLSIQVNAQYQAAESYPSTATALAGNYTGIVQVQIPFDADPNETLADLNAAGDLILLKKDGTVFSAADTTTLIAWLDSTGTQTLNQLVSSKKITAIFAQELIEEANSHTIQRLIEVNYIREANRVLTNALTSLDDALQTTDKILGTLSTIQNLHNKLTVRSPGKLSFDYLSDQVADGVDATASAYATAYQSAASAYFGPPIYPDFMWSSETAIVAGLPSGGTFHQYAEELSVAKSNLGVYLAELLPKTPTNPPGQTPNASNVDPNSLYAKSKIVYDSMTWSADGLPTFDQAKTWAIDKYDVYQTSGEDASEAGKLQQEITFAITAGQSLNDSLKEKVRRYMFVFEEYYKSASSMLAKISQLIEKMAQGLRPS